MMDPLQIQAAHRGKITMRPRDDWDIPRSIGATAFSGTGWAAELCPPV